MPARMWFVAALGGVLCVPACGATENRFEFGFARADITPSERLRLSGYGARSEPSEGVDESLYVRAMALRTSGDRLGVLVSIDTIGLSGRFAKDVARRVNDRHGIPRRGLVLSSTHSHTTPHLPTGLVNLLAVPLTAEEKTASDAYEQRLADQILAAVDQAIQDIRPGRLFAAEGRVGFARNRRVIHDGRWSGFGVTPAGPVDHAVPLLKVVDDQGALRGVVFNYACHCTTFGGGYNRVNGDWAGYASQAFEQAHPGTTALCLIGCAGDQNPLRDDDPA
ncbi:MAG: neutral/alkaline non-lysosomal ceramidase N-terminal domain-containing protein, partial [Planctomycetota bacterium]